MKKEMQLDDPINIIQNPKITFYFDILGVLGPMWSPPIKWDFTAYTSQNEAQ
jgi:hypothetical protein